MIYTQPHSNIPNVHHFKVQFEKKCQSIRHFSSFSWIPESQDIPRYPILQLPISEWCAPNNLGPESGGSWSNAKLSENWAPMEFVTASPVEKGCWWSFYWKNIMRNIYIYCSYYIYIYEKMIIRPPIISIFGQSKSLHPIHANQIGHVGLVAVLRRGLCHVALREDLDGRMMAADPDVVTQGQQRVDASASRWTPGLGASMGIRDEHQCGGMEDLGKL